MLSTASVWASLIAPILTFVAALVAIVSAGWAETRRLRSQHRYEERRKLKALIGEYRGQMLEAAVDWDRRMVQLYASREEFEREHPDSNGVSVIESYLEDKGFKNPDPVIRIYGKYCEPREYLFRSYVYRLLALCAIARKFESQAFYIDAHYAHPEDFEFLKFSKSFLWAVTSSDLPDDAFPGQDHIPNDDLRPILDSCYRASTEENTDSSSEPAAVIFDLPKLDALIECERRAVQDRLAQAAPFRLVSHAAETENASSGEEENPGGAISHDEYIPEGFGKVLQLINGLRKPNRNGGSGGLPPRLIWDRLCVLHLLAMAFIDEFGYPWQAHDQRSLERAAGHITDDRTINGFATALDRPLALLPSSKTKSAPMQGRTKTGHSALVVIELLGSRARV